MNRAHDPRVLEVLAAFERHCTSTYSSPSLVCGFMADVAGTCIERFEVPGGWTADGIRAVLVAIAAHAPDADLDEMLASARSNMQWLESTELEWAYEDATSKACPWRGRTATEMELVELEAAKRGAGVHPQH